MSLMTHRDHQGRYVAFAEAVQRAATGSQGWRHYSAALRVFALVDQRFAPPAPAHRPAATANADHDAARTAVDAVDAVRTRKRLAEIVDTLADPTATNGDILARVSAYGERLAGSGEYRQASDVFQAVIEYAHRSGDHLREAIGYDRLGSALRDRGQLPEAVVAYARAHTIAEACGALGVALKARVAESSVYWKHERLDDAARILDATIALAASAGETEAGAMAAHDRGVVAHEQGQWTLALAYYDRAFMAYRDPAKRYRLLNDIGRSLVMLNQRDSARRAYLAVYLTCREPYPRWAAAINLLDLAIENAHESAFDHYRRALAHVPMPAHLLVAYLSHVGDGCVVFDRPSEALAAFSRLRRVKTRYRIRQLPTAAADLSALRPAPPAPHIGRLRDPQFLIADINRVGDLSTLLSAANGASIWSKPHAERPRLRRRRSRTF
jgi:tetratricopeptide (TPR) repeat protein